MNEILGMLLLTGQLPMANDPRDPAIFHQVVYTSGGLPTDHCKCGARWPCAQGFQPGPDQPDTANHLSMVLDPGTMQAFGKDTT